MLVAVSPRSPTKLKLEEWSYQPRRGELVLTALQISAATFAVPALLAGLTGRYAGLAVISFTLLTSLFAHRPSGVEHELWDWVDLAGILAWLTYNGIVTGATLLDLSYHPSRSFGPQGVLVALALLFAGLTGLMAVRRVQFPWRCRSRIGYHALMHVFGAVGSVLLLMAAPETLQIGTIGHAVAS